MSDRIQTGWHGRGDDEEGLKDPSTYLGPHKMGKWCLYVKRLADLDRSVLEKLVAGSVADVKRRYGA